MAHKLAYVLLLLALAGCNFIDTEAAPEADARPNLLMISIDTLRADALGSYGAERKTPALDGLAARGTRFANVYSPAPITMPSHTSMMTGLYPPRHGVRNNGAFVVPAGAETLAEKLAGTGYATSAFVSAAVLEARFGLEQGFGHYDHETGEERGALYAERSAADTTARATAWLDANAERTEPFFMWVHYFDPHAPYEPPSPWAETHADDPYAGEVAAVDHSIAGLLADLEKRGLAESTVIAVVSDHGESLWEHGEKTHAMSIYDATQHVPFILAGPGVPKENVVETLGSLIDVAPTLLSRLGADPLPRAEGVDLLAAHEPRETVYLESMATQLDFGWSPLFGARSLTHLYVDAPRPELYDEPSQVKNLLEAPNDEQRERALAMQAIVDRERLIESASARQELDPETRERLRSLGYMIPEKENKASSVDPKDGIRAVSAYIRAQEAMRAGDLDLACKEGELSVKLLPSSARPRLIYAQALIASGDPQAALEHAKWAVRLSPGWADTHYYLGVAAQKLGDEPLAKVAFGEAARLGRPPDEPAVEGPAG